MGKKRIEIPRGETIQEYTIGQWAGIEQHSCAFCAYDTLDGRQAMLEHLLNVHSSTWAMEQLIALEAAQPLAEPAKVESLPELEEDQALELYEVDLKEEHDG
jgi:hypothetical protein